MSDMQSADEPPFKKPRIEGSSPKVTSNPEERAEKPSEESAGDSFGNFVSLEELEKLREFKVLDEVNDDDSNEGDSDSSDGKSEGVPEEEIERMLEEDLPDGFKGAPKPKEKPYVTRQKIVLEEKGVNQFEVLPLDWMMVRHYSGIPVYIHRSTRVCTLSKPYFLGKGNTRRHDIPISAIPCLAYRRALEEEEKQKEIDKQIEEQIKSGTWQNLPANAQNNKHSQSNASQSNKNNMAHINDKANDNVAKCPFKSVNNQVDLVDKVLNDDEKVDRDTNKIEQDTDEIPLENNSTILNDIQNLKMDIGENNDEANQAEPMEQVENIKIEIVAYDDDSDNCKNISQNDNSFQITDNAQAKSEDTSDIDRPNNEENSTAEIINYLNNAHQNSNQLVGEDEFSANSNDQGTNEDSKEIKYSENVNVNIESNDNSQVVNENKSVEAMNNGLNTGTPHSKQEVNDSENVNVNSDSNDNSEVVNKMESIETVNNEVNTEVPLNRQPVVLPGGIVMPPPRVETVNTSWKSQHLTYEQVNEYCRKLFKFKTVNIMHFMRWADRRKYTKARKTLQYPTLPEGTKLITIPALPANGQDNAAGKSNKRDWVMNMNGRSYLSVFHEYVRRALQKQPVYEFKQLENASSPYQATVYIGGMQYGVGHGSSKRSAKSAAARASIHILIPEMKADLDANTEHPNNNEPDFSFFDYVGIEDPRITEFCLAACEPAPHAILRTCLLRNFGAQDKHIHTEMKKLEYQKIELTMKVGKHTATVICKNKKTAKQRASQAILQALHPHVRSWGSLLRLYGSRSVKSCKEKKLEEQQITLLQDAARHNEPNYAVLEKLRNEMRKLRQRDDAVVPIGTLLVKEDLPTHSGSNLNNVDL